MLLPFKQAPLRVIGSTREAYSLGQLDWDRVTPHGNSNKSPIHSPNGRNAHLTTAPAMQFCLITALVTALCFSRGVINPAIGFDRRAIQKLVLTLLWKKSKESNSKHKQTVHPSDTVVVIAQVEVRKHGQADKETS